MFSNETPSILESLEFARRVQEIDVGRRVELMHRLVLSKRLAYTVRGLNRLAEEPVHRQMAERALHSMWLDLTR
jgi:hypothetical protein